MLPCHLLLCLFAELAERQGCVFVHMQSQLPTELCFHTQASLRPGVSLNNTFFTVKHCINGSFIEQTAIIAGQGQADHSSLFLKERSSSNLTLCSKISSGV